MAKKIRPETTVKKETPEEEKKMLPKSVMKEDQTLYNIDETAEEYSPVVSRNVSRKPSEHPESLKPSEPPV